MKKDGRCLRLRGKQILMEINHDAPVVATAEIAINADPEVVWEVISDVAKWPAWNPAVKSVSVDGPVEVGRTFRWKAGPGTITSTVQELERPHVIGWSGRTMGVPARHVYRLETRDGGTLVHTSESWEGMIASLLRKSLTKQLQASLESGLQSLKAEAERRTAHSQPPER